MSKLKQYLFLFVQVLQGGPSVQMPCIAKGDPLPTVQWFLYDTEIDSDLSSGVTIGSFAGPNGEIASYLNISQVMKMLIIATVLFVEHLYN